MNNQNKETKKIIAGLLIGVIGVSTLYYLYVAKHQKPPLLKKIGRTIADVGEMIENCELECINQVAERAEEKLPKGAEVLNNLSEWITNGVALWKKIST